MDARSRRVETQARTNHDRGAYPRVRAGTTLDWNMLAPVESSLQRSRRWPFPCQRAPYAYVIECPCHCEGGRRGALLGGSLRRCAFSALRGFDEKTRDSASLSRRQFELGVPRNIIVRQAIVAYPFHARQVHVGAEAPCLNVHAAVVNSAHLDESLAIRYRVASKSSQSAHEFSSPVGLTVLRMSCERNKRPTVALVCPIHKETGVRSPPCGQSFSGG